MKKMTLAAAILLAIPMMASANGLDTIVNSNNEVGIAVTHQNIDYHEPDELGQTGSADLDSETGSQPGIRIDIKDQHALLGVEGIYTEIRLDYAHGHTNYNGHLVAPGYPVFTATSKSQTADVLLRAGKGVAVSEDAMVTPYIGYSHHIWHRGVATDTQNGYNELYTHGAVSVGVLGQYAPVDNLVLSADVSAGEMVGAKIDSDLTGPQNLKNKSVATVGLGADYAVTKSIHVTANFDMTKFSYGASTPNDAGWYEPDSNSNIKKVAVGVAYAF